MAQDDVSLRSLVISHGPRCLDGIVCAVVIARSRRPLPTEVIFTAHADVDRILLEVATDPPPDEVWITDMSWTNPEVDRHLRDLATKGTRLYWIDHHRTAIARHTARPSVAPFSAFVLQESRCAAWLTYDFLWRRARTIRSALPHDFAELQTLVTMTDDHDRWIHHNPESHRLASVVSEMKTKEAYHELLRIDGQVTYSEKMAAAALRVECGRHRSFDLAAETLVETPVRGGRATVIAAICDGYASDIAADWGIGRRGTIFALYDRRSATVSLRRSPCCEVDLSGLAESLGGGGHAAAAGFRPEDPTETTAAGVGRRVASALQRTDTN